MLPYLRLLGYRSVDILVATHDDADHLAGIAELVPYLTPAQVWAGALDPSKKLVRSLQSGATRIGAKVLHPDQPPARTTMGNGRRQVSIETLPRPPMRPATMAAWCSVSATETSARSLSAMRRRRARPIS